MSSSSEQQLSCTTAPGHSFANRSELAEHYKSDWHAYNLKRRQAGLKLLTRLEFLARLQAAQAARREQELLKQTQRKSHLKRDKKKQKPSKVLATEDAERTTDDGETQSHSTTVPESISVPDQGGQDQEVMTESEPAADATEPAAITIDPCQSLYDSHVSASLHDNVDYMRQHYDFFIPDADYLQDLEGLLGYCHEKINIGHMCLQCHQVFGTSRATQMHMRSKQHTQLAYVNADDQEELAVFFDFDSANREFLEHVDGNNNANGGGGDHGTMRRLTEETSENGDEDDGWEDVSEDEEMKDGADGADEMDEDDDDDDDDDLYAGYADQVAQFGFSVTDLGELVLPDGRIVGHRSLRRYYKQRPKSQRTSTAVLAAQSAAGERLYQGRVYNVNPALALYRNCASTNHSNTVALAKIGVSSGRAAGRLGRGILVANGPEGSFSQLSVYRYRAAIRKLQVGELKGRKLAQRTSLNINRMGKKDNRLMNGVSVAHAKR